MDTLWFLQSTDFFSCLEKEKKEFFKISKSKILKKNEIIFFEGEKPQNCYYIENGLVRVFNSDQRGRESIFFMHKDGEMFGLSELIERQVRRSTAQALTKTTVHYIEQDAYENLIKEHFSLAKRTINILGMRVRKLSNLFTVLTSSSTMACLMYILFSLSCRDLQDKRDWQNPVVLPYKLSQEQLALMIGSTQPTISILLNKLASDQLISKSPLTILHPATFYQKYLEFLDFES